MKEKRLEQSLSGETKQFLVLTTFSGLSKDLEKFGLLFKRTSNGFLRQSN